MADQLVDDNNLTVFVDDSGVTLFFDDNGNWLGQLPDPVPTSGKKNTHGHIHTAGAWVYR